MAARSSSTGGGSSSSSSSRRRRRHRGRHARAARSRRGEASRSRRRRGGGGHGGGRRRRAAASSRSSSSCSSSSSSRGGKDRRPQVERDKGGVKLFVGRLPREVSQRHLRECFEEFGEVLEVFVIDSQAVSNVGCAFIRMSRLEEAERAVRELHEQRVLIPQRRELGPMQVAFAKGEALRLGLNIQEEVLPSFKEAKQKVVEHKEKRLFFEALQRQAETQFMRQAWQEGGRGPRGAGGCGEALRRRWREGGGRSDTALLPQEALARFASSTGAAPPAPFGPEKGFKPQLPGGFPPLLRPPVPGVHPLAAVPPGLFPVPPPPPLGFLGPLGAGPGGPLAFFDLDEQYPPPSLVPSRPSGDAGPRREQSRSRQEVIKVGEEDEAEEIKDEDKEGGAVALAAEARPATGEQRSQQAKEEEAACAEGSAAAAAAAAPPGASSVATPVAAAPAGPERRLVSYDDVDVLSD